MIRVLHVIGAMDRGGAETMVMNLYRAANVARVQFDFLVHEQRECDYDKEILERGGNIYRLPRFVGTNIASYRKLCREFFNNHPEHAIVHGHIGSSAAIYLAEANRAGRFTIAHSHAQNFEPGLAGMAFRLLAHPQRHIARYFMACSNEAGVDRFGGSVVHSSRFSVVPNGIDLARYACDEAAHQKAQKALGIEGVPTFGHVGRLAPEKNHEFLLEVFQHVKEQLPDAMLLLCGRGPLEDNLRSSAAKRGLGDAVRFLGVRDDVPDVLRAMDVFIFPSVKEGLAMAAVEAQATGLYALLSTGVPELAAISPRAQRIPLDTGCEVWADAAVEAYRKSSQFERRDECALIRDAGFGIAETSERLTAFYEKAASGEPVHF